METILIRTENLVYNNLLFYNNIFITEKDCTFITGESGSGKSTLLKLLNATLSPSEGNIFYKNENINQYDTVKLRQEIALVSQDVFLFDESIEENFKRFYSYRNMTLPTKEDIKKYMSVCCLDFDLQKNCTTMSGGERQRLYIAIFISFHPKILLLDEPTSALDNQNRNCMISNLIQFATKNSITMIIVSHDQQLVKQYSEKIIHLDNIKKGVME